MYCKLKNQFFNTIYLNVNISVAKNQKSLKLSQVIQSMHMQEIMYQNVD